MQQKPDPLEDENGFATLPLPRLGRLERLRLPGFVQRYPALYARHSHARHLAILGGTVTALAATWFMLIFFFVPTKLNLSFGSVSCTFNPVVMPRLTEHQPSTTFEAESQPSVSVAGYPLFSHKTCIRLKAAPQPSQTETLKLSPLGNPLLHKRISVVVGELPAAKPAYATDQLFSTQGTLVFNLDQPDLVFTYRLSANELSVDCTPEGTSLTCTLSSLKLAPGTSYEVSLSRIFADTHAETLLKGTIRTLDPVIITSASIAEGSTVYDKPAGITLSTNKAVQSVQNAVLNPVEPTGEPIPTEVSFENSTLSVRFAGELPRETLFELTLPEVTANDGSQLLSAYVLRFRTSGGPKVAGVSIGSSKASTGASVVLTFDSGLASGQNIGGMARVEIGGTAVAASVSAAGNRITINPSADLPRCTNFTVVLDAGLVSEYGIGGGEGWRLNSRTICQVAFSIGTSVRGRSIMAYRFGTGPSKIVYVGGMHGTEKSSVHTLQGWIDYLELNAEKLPANRSIIVIPNHSPDSYAASRRTNMNNVDLNRNFPSNDWQTAVQMPGNQFLPNGGGMTPLDQPESAALASFIQSQNPRLVLTYHAVARVIISNDAGDSVALAQQYAGDTGYSFSTGADSHGEFEYATTGEFEDWLSDKEGIPAILVELSSMTSNQFSSHRNAMWNLALIP